MPTKISKVEARQGETLNRMRYVLATSVLLAVGSPVIVAWIMTG
jgi:hypothetical protein